MYYILRAIGRVNTTLYITGDRNSFPYQPVMGAEMEFASVLDLSFLHCNHDRCSFWTSYVVAGNL